MMNMGVSSTDTGSIWVTRKNSSMTFLPLKRYLAMAYDAGTARTTAISMELREIRKLFANERNMLKSPVSTCAA